MTNKELEKAIYVNESKKRRKLKTSKNRKDWVGMRPIVFKDKTKYDRKKFKKIIDF